MAQLPQAIWSPSLCHVQRHSRVTVRGLAWARGGGTCEGDNHGGHREPCSTCFLC